MAPRSKGWVHGSSLAGNACSNLAEGIDVRLLGVLCAVKKGDLRQANPSSTLVLPNEFHSV